MICKNCSGNVLLVDEGYNGGRLVCTGCGAEYNDEDYPLIVSPYEAS